MRKQTKIAIFSGNIPSSTFIEHLIEGIATSHQVLLFGVIEHPKHYSSKNIRIYKTPYNHILNLSYTSYRLFLLYLKSPKSVRLLFKEIKRFSKRYDRWIWFSKFLPIVLYKPDLFHMQWTRDLEFYWFLKTSFRIPIVVSLRGAHMHYTPITAPYIAGIYNDTFPKIDSFHAVSFSMAKEAQGYGAIASQIKVIHSPITRSAFQKFKPYLKHSNILFKIGSVGRFHWVKGMRYALDACSLLKEQSFNYEYTIVSSNTLPEEGLFQIHQLSIEDHVTILPELKQDALFELMMSFDVLLLPSLQEGIANVVLEAMALGIPVISTDCGGMPEVVIPNETGWLVPVRDPEAIAKAIIEVSQTSELELERITKNAHDFVKTHFNAEDSITQFLELYESVYKDSKGQIPKSLRSTE